LRNGDFLLGRREDFVFGIMRDARAADGADDIRPFVLVVEDVLGVVFKFEEALRARDGEAFTDDADGHERLLNRSSSG
jgi:hypothetical protein